ncbi:MAG: mammalian cell entry protein [Frankiales bacterium]|nr:mammalian cell entry protein [Frankiales bacterium]
MAPPLVKGRALARRRVAGVVFLLVVAMLVSLSVAMYQKRFTSVAKVSLETDRAGNQLSAPADVKLRGLIVGEVRKIHSTGDHVTLDLAMKPEELHKIPKSVRAQLLPKTLFGEKEVSLVLPADTSGPRLAAGDTIGQDRSTTAIETETALNDLLPLLQSLKPERLSVTLNALSEALRGRGNRLGDSFAKDAAYFRQFNPSLPRLADDMAGLAQVANDYADTTPDLLRTLDNFSFSSRSLVQEQARLDTFLRSTKDFADSAQSIVAKSEQQFIDLAKDSVQPLKLYASFSNYYPCMLNTLAFQEVEGERVFGGAQPGLHITLEATTDKGPYVPGQEPKYKDTYNAGCFGMDPAHPIVPMPAYRQPQDGYQDDQPPDDPGTGPPGSSAAAQYFSPPAIVAEVALPSGMSELDQLLLGPMAGVGGATTG